MQTKIIIRENHMLRTKLSNTQQDDCLVYTAVKQAWQKISPWWPLKNLIAANPLQGFEDLPFEQAFVAGSYYFQNTSLQKKMADVNRETIKWCQVFFDEGQAVISMPNRSKGLYLAWRDLLHFDKNIHQNHQQSIDWLSKLPLRPEDAIQACQKKLGIVNDESRVFFTLLLTTLPGWAGYIKYRTDWTQGAIQHEFNLEQIEFLAMRMIITCLMYPAAKELIDAQAKSTDFANSPMLEKIANAETNYKRVLVNALSANYPVNSHQKIAAAQLVFCIDVRSEPFRRAIEAQGEYETLGFAGFFGIPVTIQNSLTGEEYASCPVLISPKHKISFNPQATHCGSPSAVQPRRGQDYKKVYQALKYTFTAPFALAEGLGLWSGLWMALRTLFPSVANRLKPSVACHYKEHFNLEEGIELKDQCLYAERALRIMGLTSRFAPLVVLCGHGSTTANNAYATALDCGACGGHDGAANAKILAKILNKPLVREYLKKSGIEIPDTTTFLPALHTTTTDVVTLYSHLPEDNPAVSNLRNDLDKARGYNCKVRIAALAQSKSVTAVTQINKRSIDWSETRPEWGLARNAVFIVAPRSLTKQINLHGRSFLHSYDWQQDADGSLLTTILTAPMVVAQWINCQYLFSTIDNVAYGSGSKVTHNITGKMGIMQGNASDLMHGLSLQSVKSSDKENYHEPLRLLTIVHAPKTLISNVISKQDVLKKLFGNGWVNLTCIDPGDGKAYDLQRDFSWV
jgi:uncharacterized protein YbcC (UPF0753/DUF2309 family)